MTSRFRQAMRVGENLLPFIPFTLRRKLSCEEIHGFRTEFAPTQRIKKDGKPGLHVDYVPYTPLMQCDFCGKVSTPKKIHERPYTRWWNHESRHDRDAKEIHDLCLGCWLKLKPVAMAAKEAVELGNLARQLSRSLKQWQKSQTPGN